MRTTISLDDRLAEQVRRRAGELGLSVSAFIAKTLNEALRRSSSAARPKPFRLVTVAGTGPGTGIDLDRPRALEATEDIDRFSGGRAPTPTAGRRRQGR
jgi:hypothetical protein